MKITVDRNVVEFTPETPRETSSLEILWRVIVDCARENKKLVPIGEYVPMKENLARFVIEGVPGGITMYSHERATEDCTVVCTICNKYKDLKKGGEIPNCCGRPMERLD